jgi:hypothetical protein
MSQGLTSILLLLQILCGLAARRGRSTAPRILYYLSPRLGFPHDAAGFLAAGLICGPLYPSRIAHASVHPTVSRQGIGCHPNGPVKGRCCGFGDVGRQGAGLSIGGRQRASNAGGRPPVGNPCWPRRRCLTTAGVCLWSWRTACAPACPRPGYGANPNAAPTGRPAQAPASGQHAGGRPAEGHGKRCLQKKGLDRLQAKYRWRYGLAAHAHPTFRQSAATSPDRPSGFQWR